MTDSQEFSSQTAVDAIYVSSYFFYTSTELWHHPNLKLAADSNESAD